MSSVFFGALVSGLIIGAIPAVSGAVKGKLGLGIGGFAACTVGSLLLGMILSIPLCAVFMFLIFKPAKETKPTGIGVADELKKLKELLDSGAISQDEYDMKKKQLLGE